MISGPTLAESVAAAIRAGILDGKYLSGERLIELNLAKTMGVSQITVRDALRILEQEGWVTKNPRRGVYVRSFTSDAAEEVYALIRTFEGLAMEWVFDKYTRQMGPISMPSSTRPANTRKKTSAAKRSTSCSTSTTIWRVLSTSR